MDANTNTIMMKLVVHNLKRKKANGQRLTAYEAATLKQFEKELAEI